mgnify:CR=1 FL=1
MISFITNTEIQASQADIVGPFGTLIREHREAVAIAGGITLWHYVPNLLWHQTEGSMDDIEQSALGITCSILARSILRDVLPDWLILGPTQTCSRSPTGSLFCFIVYDPAREMDAKAWMDEVFARAIGPKLIESLLDYGKEVVTTLKALDNSEWKRDQSARKRV